MFIQIGGPCYATLGILRPGKRNSRAPRHGSSAPRFGGALCGCDCALLARLIGRRSCVSFWLPGFFGSLAAAPQQPGWSLTSIYYHTSVSAGAEVARAREFETGRIPVN